ncbi:UNVERIFIED_CONTAM: MBL fold metallo-hydrolase [Prevotella sp. 15_C9]
MIKVERFVCNMLQENCYLLWDDTRECVIIDCGAFYPEERKAIARFIADNRLQPMRIIGTHAHLDHQFGSGAMAAKYGLPVECSPWDAPLMEGLDKQAKQLFNMNLDFPLPEKIKYYEEGTAIRFGNHQLEIMETPGHTPGSVTLYCREEGIAFTGDTLFRGSVGRTDFPGGNRFQMINSLRELSQLPDETNIYTGHGETTTIGYELAHNPFMDR